MLQLINSHNGTRWVSQEVSGAKAKKNHEMKKGDMMGIWRDGLFLDVKRCGMWENHLNSKEINLILD